MEEACNATCPDKCSSGNWKIHDNDLQRWKENNIINIDCGNERYKPASRIVNVFHPRHGIYQQNILNIIFMKVIPGVLPRPSDGCPRGTVGCDDPGCPNTCFCEDHCSWEKCSLFNPPQDCFHKINGKWSRKSSRDVWVAKFHGIPSYVPHIFSFKVF